MTWQEIIVPRSIGMAHVNVITCGNRLFVINALLLCLDYSGKSWLKILIYRADGYVVSITIVL